MVNVVIIIGVLCLCNPIFGFWLYSDKHTEAQFNISEECKSKAEQGDCGFFDCFEERLPCGSEGYALSYGKKYCNKFKDNGHLFTTEGRDFVQRLAVCQMKNSIAAYSQNKLECNGHYDNSFVTMGHCYIPGGLCQVDIATLLAMARILDPPDLVNYRIIREVFKAARQCPSNMSSRLMWEYMFLKTE